jgi:hypothetical protein
LEPKRAICERFFFFLQGDLPPKRQSVNRNASNSRRINAKNLIKQPMCRLICVLTSGIIFIAFGVFNNPSQAPPWGPSPFNSGGEEVGPYGGACTEF